MNSARRAIFAGFWGGMLAGVLDALVTLLGSWRVLDAGNRAHLLLIGAGLGAFAGAALVIVYVGWTLALQRHPTRSRWVSAGHAVTLVLALPVIVYDAIALFRGSQAARIPGHGLISAALILIGAAACWVAVTLWGRLLARAEPWPGEPPPRPGQRVLNLVAGLALIAVAVGLDHANRTVLPRLYAWFHLSLSLGTLLACVLAVRLLLGLGRHILGKRWSGILAGAAVLGLLAGAAVESRKLAHSQSLRYFVYEKTQLASLFARVLPVPKKPLGQTSSVAASALAPLPGGPQRPGSDVVLITVDATRADHLGCYGHSRGTTPNMDALAARGVRFERAYAQAPHTSFSVASLMTGKYYPTLARVSPSDSHETLAMTLRRYGWKTAAFFPPAVFYIDAHKMKAFESTSFDFEYVKYEYLSAERRIGQIEEFLARENPQKLFLWLHLFEPHEPYERHPGFDFGSSDVDRYDGEIAYADAVVGKVIKLIEQKRPGAIIVIAADHGEEFGEHGGRYHGTTLFEEQIRVPFIVAFPGAEAHVVSGPVELIDIPATLLGLLNFPLPARMRGTDLGPWLDSPAAPNDRLPPAFAEVEDKRMVVVGHEKLVCDIGKDFCSYFDLSSDPGEQHDLADRRPERLHALRAELDRWLAEQSRYESGAVTGGADELTRAIERGRLGDASVVPLLAELLTAKGPVEDRREAARVIATALPAKQEALPALLRAARAVDDEHIRAWAAVAAMRLGGTDAAEPVRAVLRAEARPAMSTLRVHAALVLAERGDGAGIAVLSSSLEECGQDIPLCKRVLAALAGLKDGRATKSLVAHVAFVPTRREAVEALSAIGDAGSVSVLVELLETDAYVPVRVVAATALGKLGGARAVAALRAALSREREAAVLAAIRAALPTRAYQRSAK